MGARLRVTYGIAGVGLLVGLLTGCGSPKGYMTNGSPEDSATPSSTDAANLDANIGDPYTFYAKMPNGAEVLCTGINGYYTDAPPSIDCDYTNAQGLNKPVPSQR